MTTPKTNPNDSAMPYSETDFFHGTEYLKSYPGLTKREKLIFDLYSGHCVATLPSAKDLPRVARGCIEAADILLEEMNKEGNRD